MPEANEFGIIIGAEDKPLQSALDSAIARLERFQKSVQAAAKPVSFANLNKEIVGAVSNLQSLGGEVSPNINTTAFHASITQVLSDLKRFKIQIDEATTPGAVTRISHEFDALQLKVSALKGASIVLNADGDPLKNVLTIAERDLANFHSQLIKNTDPVAVTKLADEFARTQQKISALKSATLTISADPTPFTAEMTRVFNEIDADLINFRRQLLSASDPQAVAKLTAEFERTQQKVAALKGTTIDVNANTEPLKTKLAGLETDLAGFKNAISRATDPAEIARLTVAFERTQAKINELKGATIVINADPDPLINTLNKSKQDLFDFRRLLEQLTASSQLTLDGTDFITTLDQIERAGGDFKNQIERIRNVEITVDVEGAQLKTTLAQLQNELTRFETELQNATDPADIHRLTQAFDLAKAKIAQIRGADIVIKANIGPLENTLAQIDRDFARFGAQVLMATVDANIAPVSAKLAEIEGDLKNFKTQLFLATDPAAISRLTIEFDKTQAKIEALKGAVIPISADASPITKTLDSVEADLNEFRKLLVSTTADADLNLDGTQVVKTLDQLERELVDFENQLERATSPQDVDRLTNSLENVRRKIATLKGTTVVFDADGRPLHGTLQKLQSDLVSFKSQLSEATDPTTIARLNRELTTTQQRIAALKNLSTTNLLPVGLEKIAPHSNQAGAALTNLARIAQDAPFGFIAIQNNITELIPSFQRLSTSAGGTQGAFKALAAGLSGPAGITVGLSVVTALVTSAILKYGSLQNALDSVFGSFSNIEQANRKLAVTFAESQSSIAGELSALSALVDIAKDETLARETRQQAISKINKEYDNYLPKLSIENIRTQEVTNAIENLTQSLVRQAKVRGLQDLISQESANIAKAFAEDVTKGLDFFDELLANIKSGMNPALLQIKRTELGVQNLGKTFTNGTEKITRYNQALRTLLSDEALNKTLFVEPIKIKDPKDDLKKSGLSLAALFSKARADLNEGFLKLTEDSEKGLDKYIADLQRSLDEKAKKVNFQLDIVQKGIIDLPDSSAGAMPEDPLIRFFDRRQQLLDKFSSLGIKPPDFSWLSDVGAQIMILNEALGKGVEKLAMMQQAVMLLQEPFEQFFDAIISGSGNAFKTFGQALKSLIKQLLTTIATAAVLSLILSAIGGGSFLANFTKMLGGSGGILKGIGGSLSGGHSEDFGNRSAGPSIESMNRGLVGSAMQIEIVGETRIEGNDMVTTFRRVLASQGRTTG